MKITIFWTWYVWLVSWACLADLWHDVLCIDIDEEKIANLKKWIIPIYEANLEELVKKNIDNWRLHFSTSWEEWIRFWKAIMSAVWTPEKIDWEADLKYVYQIAETFWKHIDEEKILINKSTVPVWTANECKDIIKKILEDRGVDIEFHICSNPEFLREGTAVKDTMNPSRIIAWVESDFWEKAIREIYKPITDKWYDLMITDLKSSEIIKYASNAFLATKISFINEIANFTEVVGWNINDISKWMWMDNRIGPKFLNAWIWYGGSCFPKDISALIQTWKKNWYEFEIIKATNKINESQKVSPIKKLHKALKWELQWKTIAIWGLTYKPWTDDIRDAPSLEMIKEIASHWIKKIKCFDPVAWEKTKDKLSFINNLEISKSKEEAISWADCLIILTEWEEFKNADIDILDKYLNKKIIIDSRNIWTDKKLEEKWYIYIPVWIKNS